MRGAFIATFTSEKWRMIIKKFILQSAIDTKFFHSALFRTSQNRKIILLCHLSWISWTIKELYVIFVICKEITRKCMLHHFVMDLLQSPPSWSSNCSSAFVGCEGLSMIRSNLEKVSNEAVLSVTPSCPVVHSCHWEENSCYCQPHRPD
jgi:hypothetical protein